MFEIKNENTLIIPNGTIAIFSTDFDNIDKTKIKKVILPDTLEMIKDFAFSDFASLEEINFPSSLEEICEYAFKGCLSLKHVELNEGLTTIESGAFDNCCLRSLHIPSTVSKLDSCIAYNYSLNKITVDKENETYSDMDCNIIYDKKENKIIQGCKNSTIPKDAKILDSECFLGTNIKYLTIPKNIETVELDAFYDSSIEKVIINCKTNLFSDRIFNNCEDLKKIYVKEIDESSAFYIKYKDKINLITLDSLIESGKSFKEANKIIKEIEKTEER